MEFVGDIEVRMYVPGQPERKLTNLNENARKIIAILGGRCENYYASKNLRNAGWIRHSALIFERVIFFHRRPEQVNDIN